MNKVFLSYSSEDFDFVEKLYLRLKKDGVDCFFDRESIAWGTNWVVELEKGLVESELIVLILTPAFFNSEWTEQERTVSMINKKAKVLPLLLKECDIPGFLSTAQFKDISTTEKFERRYLEICRELGGNPKEEMPIEDRDVLPPVGQLPSRNYMPHGSLNARFKGRVKDFWNLDDRLRIGKTAIEQDVGVGVVVGMGGLGKTQLAIEYAHRFGKFYPGGVFWVDVAQGKAAMIDRVARSADIKLDDKLPEEEQLQSLWQRLGALPPSLIILDNFPSGYSINAWKPPHHNTRILVTTLRKDFSSLSPLNLDVLSHDEGINLLNSGNREFGKEAGELVEMLGGLPLALELARKFLDEHPVFSISSLIAEIKRLGEMKALQLFAEKYGDELPSSHSLEIVATFQLSWDQASDYARQVMAVISILAPAPVPRYLLRKIFNLDDHIQLDDPLETALSQLSQKLSLLNLDQDKDPYYHRLISAFVSNLSIEDTSFHNKITTTLVDEMERATDVADTSALRELEKVLPHADHLLSQETLSLSPEQQVDLALFISRYHVNWGRFGQALSYTKQALDQAKAHYPTGDPEIANCCNEFAVVLRNLGQYQDAIEYYEQALESDLKTYGKEHPQVAIRWNNLGAAYDSLGQYDKAIEYYEKALESDLKTYGKDHPQVAIYWNNLGLAYDNLGQYKKAIEYYEQALESNLKTYGKDHPKVAIRWNNLGEASRAQGQYDKAIEYYEKALESDLKTYGKDHPDVAIDWNNLGMAYYSLRQYKKAIKYYEQALAVFKRMLGDDHPSTKTVQENLNSARRSLMQ